MPPRLGALEIPYARLSGLAAATGTCDNGGKTSPLRARSTLRVPKGLRRRPGGSEWAGGRSCAAPGR